MTTAQRAPSTPLFSGVVVVSTVPSARIASVVILSPVVCDISITGEITAEFKDLTSYNRFVNASHAAIVATWEGSAITGTYKRKISVSIPVARFDGDTPQVGGPEILDQTLTFKGLYNGTDEPITITVVNEDTAA